MLLIMGTVLIPNAVIIMIVGVSFGGVRNIYSLHVQMRKYRELDRMLENPVDRGDLTDLLNSLPEGIDYYITDAEEDSGTFEKSILPGLVEAGKKMEAIPFRFKGGNGAVLFLYSPMFEKYAILQNTPFQIIAPLILLSVLTILSLGVIRSINNSLKRIEEATRRVAQGYYDFELPVKGNDSIASLSRSFNTMVKQVREEYSRRSRFFMGVSHDLKTPLASIGGYADAILEGYAEDRETLQKYAGIIKEKSQLLLDRITHLIRFVKLETGDWRTTFRDVNMKSFLDEIAESAAVDAELYGYGFVRDIDLPDSLAVPMDEKLVKRSFENIVNNAFRYAYKNSTIELKSFMEEGRIYIIVSNHGRGIAEKDINYIFEPFYRGSSSRNEDGFGLGLANVAAVIKSHKWKIAVDSVQEGKTSFIITIPV